jgi:hypothetical protein
MRVRIVLLFTGSGIALGALVGGTLAMLSIVAGGHTWAGMLLIDGVASFPAGLWAIDLSTEVITAGGPDLVYLAFVVGPATNFGCIAALLGIIAALSRRR